MFDEQDVERPRHPGRKIAWYRIARAIGGGAGLDDFGRAGPAETLASQRRVAELVLDDQGAAPAAAGGRSDNGRQSDSGRFGLRDHK